MSAGSPILELRDALFDERDPFQGFVALGAHVLDLALELEHLETEELKDRKQRGTSWNGAAMHARVPFGTRWQVL